MSVVRRHSVPLRLEPPPRFNQSAWVFHLARWSPVVVVAFLMYLLFPGPGQIAVPVLEAGEVVPEDILAPFDFDVTKAATDIQREGDALAATVRPIYEFRADAVDSVVRSVEALFAALDSVPRDRAAETALRFGLRLTPEEAQHLYARRPAFRAASLRLIQRYLAEGVPAGGVLEAEAVRDIVVRRAGRERVVERTEVPTFSKYLAVRATSHPDPNSSVGDQLYVKLLNATFRPTLVPNRAETEAVRAELRMSVDSVKDHVRADERIVMAHEVVTDEARDRLIALRAELVRRGAEGRDAGVAVGQVLTSGLVVSVFWLFLLFYRRRTYDELRQVMVLGMLFALVAAGAAINRRFIPGPELIPIPFAAMLISILFSGRLALVAAIILTILIGGQPVYGGPEALFLAMAGGVAAALSVRTIRRRTQILTSSAAIAAAFVCASVAVGLRGDWAPADIGGSAIAGAANALISGALVVMLLPIFESAAAVITDMTLLELSDPQRPLLRRLATEAPGTYAHSVAMANLCEAAVNAIGGNGLLARVGCYYHDIGKLKRPQFFVENQVHGVNPHDKLKPDVSASIIRNHVKEGLALAQEYRLPEAVTAFIPEHHGTAEIAYFLDRARTSQGDVTSDVYRYPGPRPRSVETAVALLADSVEAALRVLDDPTPQKLGDALDHLVQHRIEAGQLADAPLTMAQLDRVKREFIRVLAGMYHTRIEYPTAAGGISAEWDAASGA